MGSYHIDQTKWPIMVVTMEGTLTDQEFDQYLLDMAATFSKGERVGVIIDARKSLATPSNQRTAQANWMRQHEATLKTRTAGMAFVMTSRLIEGIFRAVLWMQPLPCPHKITGSMDEAIKWLEEQLAKPAPKG